MSMNRYGFNDLYIGQKETFAVEISDEKQSLFEKLSGDVNPLHVNDDFAVKRGFQGRVLHGMAAASFYSTLVGVYLPGEHCLLNECNVTFRKPVYVGDVLTIEGKVVDIREGTQRVKIHGTAMNQNGEVVNSAVISVSMTQELT